MTRIKICGIRRPEDVAYVNEYQPDYVGFVFAKSRRQVTLAQAVALKSRLKREILSTGVFVDAEQRQILAALAAGAIDWVQLHGSETAAYVKALKAQTAAPVIQAFAVSTPADLARARVSPADYVLLDNRVPGSGRPFDWKLLADLGRPYFLAGGLNPENAAAAVARFKPYAVDVSSGVETAGVKDKEKIKQMIRRIRDVQR